MHGLKVERVRFKMRIQMMNNVIYKTLEEVYKYLNYNFTKSENEVISKELRCIVLHEPNQFSKLYYECSYEDIQSFLSCINEKSGGRKNNGVYYTSNDVVRFIYFNTIKSLYGNIKSTNLHVQDLNGIPYRSFSFAKKVFDPTCGAGEFLLVALSVKLDLVDLHQTEVSCKDIKKVIKTIFGNDINEDSVVIAKIRLFLFVLHRYGVEKIIGIAKELNNNFGTYDFINLKNTYKEKYDIIIGNPPYVEDSKCDTKPLIKYGNVYANVLHNVADCLADKGAMGFIIPLSYVSTPRMQRIRKILNEKLSEQYILSYCDRPDCLFPSVHQKLCILIGKNNMETQTRKIYTGNYQFWYKEERDNLFINVPAILNKYVVDEYIPKLGTPLDCSIYKKVTTQNKSLKELFKGDIEFVYINMRAAFWIKAFRKEHCTGEYKIFTCSSKEDADLCMCIMNSSLFWWYWICVSDCWHITNKELNGFKVPKIDDYTIVSKLAKKLEKQLEKTKKYVGTKQTDYEYKHKDCTNEIHEIDDLICSIYGLTDEETIYIKNFAYRYRISGGVAHENN